MRELAGLSIAVFIGQHVAKTGRPDRLLVGVLLASLATSAAAIAEYVTGISYYVLLTEGAIAPTYWNLRVRGLNFEPRGLGLVGAHAIVIGVLCVAYNRHARAALTSETRGMGSASTSDYCCWRRSRRRSWRNGAFTEARARFTRARDRSKAALSRSDCALQSPLTERVGSTVRFGLARNWFEQIVYRMEIRRFRGPSARRQTFISSPGRVLASFPCRRHLICR